MGSHYGTGPVKITGDIIEVEEQQELVKQF